MRPAGGQLLADHAEAVGPPAGEDAVRGQSRDAAAEGRQLGRTALLVRQPRAAAAVDYDPAAGGARGAEAGARRHLLGAIKAEVQRARVAVVLPKQHRNAGFDPVGYAVAVGVQGEGPRRQAKAKG